MMIACLVIFVAVAAFGAGMTLGIRGVHVWAAAQRASDDRFARRNRIQETR